MLLARLTGWCVTGMRRGGDGGGRGGRGGDIKREEEHHMGKRYAV